MTIVKLFLWPRGRLSRAGFWRALLMAALAAFAIDLGLYLAGLFHPLEVRFYLALAGLYVWLCLAAKRLEDVGRSRLLAAIPAAALVLGLASTAFLVGALDGRAPAPTTMIGVFGPLAGMLVFLGATAWIGAARTKA